MVFFINDEILLIDVLIYFYAVDTLLQLRFICWILFSVVTLKLLSTLFGTSRAITASNCRATITATAHTLTAHIAVKHTRF